MFAKTDNPYKFKYLVTGITGPGIEQVYLPPIPAENKILFKKEQKFVRPEMSEQLRKWAKEYYIEKQEDEDFIHPHQKDINAWEDQEDERCENGIFFWNNGVVTYITGFYYWMLTAWQPYFGRPTYRATDKEITYWIKYWEEDPNSYGGALNTIRRYGKSSIMGAWIVYRTTRNFNHNSGMQGESDKKIAAFYKKFVLRPFHKLPPYLSPQYNMDTKQAAKIEFAIPPRRSKKLTQFDMEDQDALDSMIDYRSSGAGEYDGEILNSYLGEEPGKREKVSLYDEEGEGQWDVIKPCFLQGGEDICGKAFFGTTVENLKVVDKGGKAYQRLFYDSDFNMRGEDGRTMSGLYTAFLRARYALKGYIDEWGEPIADKAWEYLSKARRSYAKRPSKLAGWIRKFPDTIEEIFYVNPENCEFNSMNIQDQLQCIYTGKIPAPDRIDFYWENNVRDTKVKWRHAPDSGWCQLARGVGFKEMANNLVVQKGVHPDNDKVPLWFPLNDRLAIGCDPIEHGVVSQPGRSSKPVIFVKEKYSEELDGVLTQELLEQRAEAKYPYRSNRPILLYDKRPTDPNKFFEYAIMICVYFGCQIHVESQKPAIISYFHARGYGAFIQHKYKPKFQLQDKIQQDGTPSSQPLIQQYTSLVAHQKEYFCHLNPFKEVLQDNLVFTPVDTKPYDYTVAEGFAELACEMKSQIGTAKRLDIGNFFHTFDRNGNVLN